MTTPNRTELRVRDHGPLRTGLLGRTEGGSRIFVDGSDWGDNGTLCGTGVSLGRGLFKPGDEARVERI